jgi:peptidoglycan/LPS O-acetylase OafA/YrhL
MRASLAMAEDLAQVAAQREGLLHCHCNPSHQRRNNAFMKFRTDIQILRAIAVIFVVFYHLEVPGFANGLLGVDIFFAISGYLMFRIYDFDRGAGGFYVRRGQRLLPGYFATILCTLAACLLMVQPSDFLQTSQQALYGALFASNIGFWAQNSYFNNVDFKPLLHLWSLAVELQFYLFVPLIMLLDRWNKYVLPALVAGSLALCLILLILSPNASFFMMPTRLWQFGLGMLAARASARGTGTTIIGMAAMLALIAMLFFPTIGYGLGVAQRHPGLGAILATVATALCLYHGLPERLWDNLAGRTLRYIGDISYSIYLVHFPVIVLFNYQFFAGTNLGAPNITSYIAILAWITALAWLSHQIFEKRAASLVSVRSALGASAVVAITAWFLPGGQAQLVDGTTNRISAAFTDRAPYRCGTRFRILHFRDEFCTVGSAKGSRGFVMLIGDSHSDAIKTTMAAEANREGLGVLFPVSNDSLASPMMDEYWLLSAARRYRVQQVFLHFSLDNIKPETVKKAYVILNKEGIALTYIMPIPKRKKGIPLILLNAHQQGTRVPLKPVSDHERDIAQVSAQLRKPRPGYTVVEPSTVLCTPDCQIQDGDGNPYYFDKHRLTLTGARQLAPLFRKAMDTAPFTSVK